jgi:hypothetical protein
MPYVSSSAIARVEYDPSTRHLQVWFHGSGGPYTYYGVPQYVYDALICAASIGSYFNAYIRDQYSIAS